MSDEPVVRDGLVLVPPLPPLTPTEARAYAARLIVAADRADQDTFSRRLDAASATVRTWPSWKRRVLGGAE